MSIIAWRIMCFDHKTEKLLKIIDLGVCELEDVRRAINPADNQEMCGSYELDKPKLHWLSAKFNRTDLLDLSFDMFLERES